MFNKVSVLFFFVLVLGNCDAGISYAVNEWALEIGGASHCSLR